MAAPADVLIAKRSTEEVVWIDGPAGRLLAIVHTPALLARPSTCVVMLNSGQQNRVGPQRLYLKAARAWANLGVIVLRLDLAGVGDSQAENSEVHFDSHSEREVDAAVSYATDVLGADTVVLQGLCAGARVAFKCAADNATVKGVLAWSCTVLTAAESMPQSPYSLAAGVSTARAQDTMERLVRAMTRLKFLKPAWWRARLKSGLRAQARQLERSAARLIARRVPASDRFLDSVSRYIRDERQVLFVYGDKDKIPFAEFSQQFGDVHEGREQRQGYCLVSGGTHTFSSIEAQRDVIAFSGDWLARHILEMTPAAEAKARL